MKMAASKYGRQWNVASACWWDVVSWIVRRHKSSIQIRIILHEGNKLNSQQPYVVLINWLTGLICVCNWGMYCTPRSGRIQQVFVVTCRQKALTAILPAVSCVRFETHTAVRFIHITTSLVPHHRSQIFIVFCSYSVIFIDGSYEYLVYISDKSSTPFLKEFLIIAVAKSYTTHCLLILTDKSILGF